VRILLPSIVDPWTHAGGAAAATRGLLALLQTPPLAAEVDVVVPGSVLPHRARQILAVARAAVSDLPSKALFLDTASFRRRLRALASGGRYDLALINGSDLLDTRRLLPTGVPVVLYVHNLEHALFASQLDRLPRLVRACLRSDLDTLARFERAGMRAVDGALFISADDRARVLEEGLTIPTLHLPPLFGYAPPPRQPRPPASPIRLGFLANFDWWPNRDAVRWLLHEILPRVARPDLRVHLFGAGSTRYGSADPRVLAHGFVEDVARAFAASDVMLCPMTTGAGVNVKFAEALYNGVPVLGTRFAARGLPPLDERSVLLADSADAWIRILSGTRIWQLADTRVPPGTAAAFAPTTHGTAVRELVRLVATEPAKNERRGPSPR
jgi:glycosyltransferase involved in cell wall biosynthesis